MTAVCDKVRDPLPPAAGCAPRHVLMWMADGLYDLVADSWEPLARQPAGDPGRVTVGEVCALDVVARRQPLRAAGLRLRLRLRLRLLDAVPDAAARGVQGVRDELGGLFDAWCAEFERALRLRPVPVADQVEHQTRTVPAAAESASALSADGRAAVT